MAKRTAVCMQCGRKFEVDEDDVHEYYLCPHCNLKTFRGMKK